MHPSLDRNRLNLRWRIGRLRWLLFVLRHQFFRLGSGSRLIAGRRISLQGRLRLRGPGTVVLGDDLIIASQTDLYTESDTAIIEIGEGCFLNGCRLSAQEKIKIGQRNILADVRMMDTDFHWLHANRISDRRPAPSAPVTTGSDVWLAAQTGILKGAEIGDRSIVAFGSVVKSGQKIPAGEIWAGSPAQRVGAIPEK
jgi:acetyltransferase-like isoleucine patch superfamily enzyme